MPVQDAGLQGLQEAHVTDGSVLLCQIFSFSSNKCIAELWQLDKENYSHNFHLTFFPKFRRMQ